MIYKSYLVEKNINIVKEKIILLYGENLGLQNDFKTNVKQNNFDNELVNFSQEDIIKNSANFFNEVLNMSLFDKDKFFFISNVNDKILPIIQELSNKLDKQKIYLFAEILDKRSKLRNYFEKEKNFAVIPCYADNELTIKNMIQEKLKGFSNLSPQVLNLIIENSLFDRSKVNNEINKITLLFKDKIIDINKLKDLLNLKVNNNFDNLKNEAINGNKINTNKLLSETIIETEKNILYLSLINQRLLKLAEVIELNKRENLESVVNTLKPPIFWKDKPLFMTQVRKWNSKKIKKVLNETYNLELKIKSNSSINQNILIKKLLVDICNFASS
jgi:DNA polymerase-3 subunit delta